ncbi:MAG: A24 family peptidase [Candidatus Limnocylindrales bacterium]
MTGAVLVAAILGAVFGFAADRLSSRWPLHEDEHLRGLDWRTAAVTLAGGGALAALTWRWSDPLDLLVLGVYVAALIVLLATDLDQKLLPDLITFPLMGYALLVLLTGLNPVLAGKTQVFIAEGDLSALLAAVAAPALLAVTDRLFRGALGLGDLKLAVSLGLMFGVTQLFAGFLVGTIAFAAIVLALVLGRRVSMKTAVPFGPALIAAGVAAAVMAPPA